ncbi:alkaline phosphatase D family protein [Corynebacterium lowii]|uniref:Phospholipase D n=1 Tax=Corynebacterium lowii TaxID=1544413 RepID=A0A0Q0UE10_9CORY|nr:alkaline phosphatase D family protein [Corynebacterium lowii]KQB86089.1 Phospholipase D precursor [Corynebacterium lowii]MDP9852562.1 alkaline phosphatase D [Corynebacterium lowii]
MNSPIARRNFLKSASLLGVATLGASTIGRNFPRARAEGPGAPFQHSVASGDPLATGVIIWTRVTPIPEAVPGSGLGEPTTVAWEVATDAEFAGVVQRGEYRTSADSDHTVKIDVQGLQPATAYFYRFRIIDGPATGAVSRTGRTRTTPAESAAAAHARFGVASCSNFESGYFRGYREMAEREDIEFVLHLGDYTYEYETGGYNGLYDTQVRTVQPANRTRTLTDYRIRQGMYHLDPDLADLHAAKPMIAIWDDHEFGDNAWREGLGGNSAAADDNFTAIKAEASRAYFEWMPVRPAGPDYAGLDQRLYRTLRYGNLFEFIIPDLRSYRDVQLLQYGQANRTNTHPDFLRKAADPSRSMMGSEQFQWFSDSLTASQAQWQIVANEVMFAPMTLPDSIDPRVHSWLVDKLGVPDQGFPLNVDQWDGFMAERQRIIDLIAGSDMGNVVFLTGDIHSSWASDIPRDIFAYRSQRGGQAAATEFVAPSITAPGMLESLASKPELTEPMRAVLFGAQEGLKFMDPWYKMIDFEHHGYMTIDVTPERVRADWRYTADVLSPATPFFDGASYQTFAGQPGAVRV